MIIKKKSDLEKPNIIDYTFDNYIEDEYNYKYGDIIFNNLITFCMDFENDNLILKNTSADSLYYFFDNYVDRNQYVEEPIDYESSSDESIEELIV